MIAIQINRAGFNKQFGDILAQAQNPTQILVASGRELANQLKKHFRTKDQTEPNKLSSRREHFWLQISSSVNNPEQTGHNSISVRISDPRIAQKVFGGTITAKRAGALTIPVSEEAYGRTAATFERETGLKLFLIKIGGTKSNSLTNAVLAAKRSGGLEIEYVLRQSVTQQKDPTALPPQSELEKAILARAQAVADRQAQQN